MSPRDEAIAHLEELRHRRSELRKDYTDARLRRHFAICAVARGEASHEALRESIADVSRLEEELSELDRQFAVAEDQAREVATDAL